MSVDNGGPRLTMRLHNGTTLIMERHGDTWILGPGPGEHHEAIMTIPGYDDRIDDAGAEVFNELWRTARSIVEQIATHAVAATSHDLVRMLDHAVAEPPF